MRGVQQSPPGRDRRDRRTTAISTGWRQTPHILFVRDAGEDATAACGRESPCGVVRARAPSLSSRLSSRSSKSPPQLQRAATAAESTPSMRTAKKRARRPQSPASRYKARVREASQTRSASSAKRPPRARKRLSRLKLCHCKGAKSRERVRHVARRAARAWPEMVGGLPGSRVYEHRSVRTL